MKVYFSEKRPNGQPIDPGTLCLMTDLEDGTHPIPTYAKTQEELNFKLAQQNANAQIAMLRRMSAPMNTPTVNTPAAVATVADTRFRLSPDEVIQYTEDQKNWAKSANAILMLHAHATGIDPRKVKQDKWVELALGWEAEHPEFFAIHGNRKVLGDFVGAQVQGEVERITKEMLTTAYHELLAKGLLYEPQEQAPAVEPVLPPSALPVESQVQSTERQRRMFTSHVRGNSLRAPQNFVQPKTLKYTEREIRQMPLDQAERLLRDKDPDYAVAVRHYFPMNQQRTA